MVTKTFFRIFSGRKGVDQVRESFSLPQDSVIQVYDLSNDSISNFPDLSVYNIKSLDLSCNLLDTIVIDNLPKNWND